MPRKSSCTLCSRKDTCNMVKCERCKKWQHFKCAGVTRAVKDQSYSCVDCRNAEQASGTSKNAVEYEKIHEASSIESRRAKTCGVCVLKISKSSKKCFQCETIMHEKCGAYDPEVKT